MRDTIEMAREAGLIVNSPYLMPHDNVLQGIKAFEALVRADERALAAPTSADYAMGYAEGFNDGCKPAPVQEPVAWRYTDARGHYRYRGYVPNFDAEYQLLKPQALCLCTPPAAQRQWVGLTDEEVMQTMSGDWTSQFYFARAIEAKLKAKNSP